MLPFYELADTHTLTKPTKVKQITRVTAVSEASIPLPDGTTHHAVYFHADERETTFAQTLADIESSLGKVW